MATRTEPGTPLTANERAIVTLVAAGRTNAEIARDRRVSVRTVHAHLRNLYAKTGTQNRVELTNWLRAAPAARSVPAPRNPARETEQPVTAPAPPRRDTIRIRLSHIETATIRHVSATLASGEHVSYARQDGTTVNVTSLSVALTEPRRDIGHVAVHGTTADGQPADDAFTHGGHAVPRRALEHFYPPELARLMSAVIEADARRQPLPAGPPAP